MEVLNMIKIISDSTCDLDKSILEQYNIDIAPLNVNINGTVYKDGVTITPDQFYKMMETFKEPPVTAAPSPIEFLNLMKKAAEDGYDEILCICMSSGTSACYQSAEIAKTEFFEECPDSNVKIHVVDSKGMSHGSGWLIMKSARLIEKGASFTDLVEFNESYKTLVKHFLSVDDLDNLIRSGRLTNASAVIGKLFKIKPIMSMRKGKGAIIAKARGRKKVFEHYLTQFKSRVDILLTDFIIIGYTSDISVAENLKVKIENETNYNGEIFIMQMGVSVGTHVGLGGLSLYFIEKHGIHDGLMSNEMKSLVDRRKKIFAMMKEHNMINIQKK
jgi:DegV family protein with EDD domain